MAMAVLMTGRYPGNASGWLYCQKFPVRLSVTRVGKRAQKHIAPSSWTALMSSPECV